jgi:hypothetical protein
MDESDTEAITAELAQRTQRLQVIIDRLQEDKPGLPTITYVIMAGDIDAGNRADDALRSGDLAWSEALMWCGSYSRCDMAVKWRDAGIIPRDALLDRWPALWSGSDPDDTDPRYLEVWREAWARNGGTVCDGPPIPGPSGQQMVDVFRGQMEEDPFGIAWSLSEATARKFAHGASVRAPVAGIVYQGVIIRSRVMGYLTERGEQEVILCPADLLTGPMRGRK